MLFSFEKQKFDYEISCGIARCTCGRKSYAAVADFVVPVK
jgi:hypothetical protein